MTQEITVRIDLTATTNTRSISNTVLRPSSAVTCRVYARASGWGTGTAAVVKIRHGPADAASFADFVPAVNFSADGVSEPLFVADKPTLRAEVTTAGVTGTFLDQDAAFTFVFSDKQE